MLGSSAGVQNSFVIRNQRVSSSDLAVRYNLTFPGTNDEPGHRDISIEGGGSAEGHVGGSDGSDNITQLSYHFPTIYGNDVNGNPVFNQITEVQKQRVRQVMDIWSFYSGIQFTETPSSGFGIAVGNVQVGDPGLPPVGVGGLSGNPIIINSSVDWGQSEFGGGFFNVVLHEVGHNLGLLHASDLPPGNIMGQGGEDALVSGYLGGVEPVFPGDGDITHIQLLHRPDNRDIDFYRFDVGTRGTLRVETVAQRRVTSASLLDSVLSIYDSNFNLVARNDDFYGKDSYLEIEGMQPGTYYVAVTASGNTDFDGRIADSGFGARPKDSTTSASTSTPPSKTAL